MIGVLFNIRSIQNVGSIFRTGDGVAIKSFYLCGITPAPIDILGRIVEKFSKVSLGAEKSIPWEKVGKDEELQPTIDLLKRLKQEGYIIVSIEQSPKSITYFNFKPKSHELEKLVVIVGNEVEGIPQEILNMSDHILEIPMAGSKESLNVSVAFGIVAYRLKYQQ